MHYAMAIFLFCIGLRIRGLNLYNECAIYNTSKSDNIGVLDWFNNSGF